MSPTGYIGIKYQVELQICPHSVLSPLGLEETSLYFETDRNSDARINTDFSCYLKNPQVIPLEPLVSYSL